MSSNIVNQAAYLRTSRDFPQEAKQLSVELSKSYIDTANSINVRIIGIFPTTRPSITGEGWFLVNNQKQQTFRQAYVFTTTANIPHNIKTDNIYNFSRCWGVYYDGTNWNGIIFANSAGIAGQLTFYLTSSNIVFVGAATIVKAQIVLEWLSLP